MKLKYLFIFAALTGLAAAGPVPNDQAAAVVPDWVDTDGVEGISLAELQAFVDCVRRRNDPLVSGRHGAEALKLAVDICRRTRERPS